MADVPKGVNQHQWYTLIGLWCQDSHTKLCEKNSQCAKNQKNSHTTGRKSHARLRKEMEIIRKAKVPKIDLWDEAHKKKNGNYSNENTKILIEELAKRKTDNNGSLSLEDYREVFKRVHGKESQLRGYYNEKYWSGVKVSQGLTFVKQPEQDKDVQFALRAVEDDVEDMRDEMTLMRTFISKKNPGEDWRNVAVTTENDEGALYERGAGSDIPHESEHEVEESNRDPHAPPNTMQGYILATVQKPKWVTPILLYHMNTWWKRKRILKNVTRQIRVVRN